MAILLTMSILACKLALISFSCQASLVFVMTGDLPAQCGAPFPPLPTQSARCLAMIIVFKGEQHLEIMA